MVPDKGKRRTHAGFSALVRAMHKRGQAAIVRYLSRDALSLCAASPLLGGDFGPDALVSCANAAVLVLCPVLRPRIWVSQDEASVAAAGVLACGGMMHHAATKCGWSTARIEDGLSCGSESRACHFLLLLMLAAPPPVWSLHLDN